MRSHRATCQLTILGAATGKSFVALEGNGQARWYYEPAAGPFTSPATLTSTITYLLRVPQDTAGLAAYRALPLKGQVGRSLQDEGLTVTLRISQDVESFEATTDIDITSPARPWLGTITLSDDAALDWHCDLRPAGRVPRERRRPHRHHHPGSAAPLIRGEPHLFADPGRLHFNDSYFP